MGKLVKCKTCGVEIAKSANVCPHCGAKQKKHIVLGVFLTVFGIFLLLIAVGSSGGDTQDRDSGENTKQSAEQKESEKALEVIEIDAPDLWMAYDENEVNADNLYKNKTLTVSGEVHEIGKDLVTDVPYILLKAGDSLGIYSIQCYFTSPSAQDAVADIRDGDHVIISGKCAGKIINVMVRNCTLQ